MKYDASSVKVLEGLEGIRTRPDMYVTDTSYEGLHQCFIEGFVNAVDEAQVGFGKIINITMLNPIGFIVEDFGRGMPVENFEDTGIPTAEILFTKMHSGGKMDDGAYKTSVGQMGLGCKILNTLGELTDVSINRDGYNWTMSYSRMETVKRLTRGAKTSKTGTTVKWIPDNQIFDTLKFSPSKIKTIVKDMAYLTPGVTYNILEEATGKKDVFMFKRGLFDLYDDVVTKGTILRKPIVIEYDKEINLQILLNYSDEMEFVRNYANCLKMQEDGGTHMSGFRAGLTKAINQFAKDSNLLKDKDGTIEGSELRSGMIMIMKLNMSGIKFANQTKTKVNNPFLTSTVSSIVYNSLMEYFKIYPEHAKLIINKALLNRKVRLAVQKAKEVALGTKETKKLTNIVDGSFKACLSKKPHECEVYICEGESASSNIAQSRNPKYHAIMPLKGKVLNTIDHDLIRVLENKELRELVLNLGCGIGDDFDISKLRFHKIVILTDADVDGLNIQNLLLTFFITHMPELITHGNVYIGYAPLFEIALGNNKFIYCTTDDEFKKTVAKLKPGYKVSRLKGLGSMTAQGFKETVMNPERRILRQVVIDDLEEAREVLRILQSVNNLTKKDFILTGEFK